MEINRAPERLITMETVIVTWNIEHLVQLLLRLQSLVSNCTRFHGEDWVINYYIINYFELHLNKT